MNRWLRWFPTVLLLIGLGGLGWFAADRLWWSDSDEDPSAGAADASTTTLLEQRSTTTEAATTTTTTWATTTTSAPDPPAEGVTVSQGHRYHAETEWSLDVYQSPNPEGGARPALLYMSNDPGDAVVEILSGVADQGVVVFSARWRAFSPDDPAGVEAGIEDAGCLLRFIAAQGPAFGADPERVTIAGHGLAGLVGLVAAVYPQSVETLDPSRCAYPVEPARPGGSLVQGSENLPADAEGYPPVVRAVYDPQGEADRSIRIRFDLASSDDVEELRVAADRLAAGLADVGHETAVVLFPLSLDMTYRVNVIMETTRW